jgi:hypothetical protein
MRHATSVMYQQDDSRPLILELEREFLSSHFGDISFVDGYILIFLNPTLKLLMAFLIKIG